MRGIRILLLSTIALFNLNIINAQDKDPEIEGIIERINTETTPEKGCKDNKISLNSCTVEYSLECGNNEFKFSFNLSDIGRIYMDKADFEDQFETLFFECKDGSNCITSNSDRIPPTPVFPIKLPKDEGAAIGNEAVALFSSLITKCQ